MTNNTGYFSYSLPNSDTLGKYQYNIYCQDEINNITYSNNYGNDFYIVDKNISYGDNSYLNLDAYLVIISIAFLLYFAYLWKRNIVVAWASATTFLLFSLTIWFNGINIQLKYIEDILYYSIPLWVSGGVGTILVVFAIWLFIESATKNEETNDNIEYDEEH
jgi:hypothetical protein